MRRRMAERLGKLLACTLLCCQTAAAAVSGPPEPGPAAGSLGAMTLSLTHTRPYQFVLAYHGSIVPFRGPVCYHFAGYNETCTDPHLEWLTPATEIVLYAPGGVPRDLLEGYVMLVRFPAVSARTFRYALNGAG